MQLPVPPSIFNYSNYWPYLTNIFILTFDTIKLSASVSLDLAGCSRILDPSSWNLGSSTCTPCSVQAADLTRHKRCHAYPSKHHIHRSPTVQARIGNTVPNDSTDNSNRPDRAIRCQPCQRPIDHLQHARRTTHYKARRAAASRLVNRHDNDVM